MKRVVTCALLCACLAAPGFASADAKQVTLVKTPGHGIQPQALVDGKGILHLLYFQGEPRGGNLFYVRRQAGAAGFGRPLRVNSQDGSAIAIGTIRGGHLALGKSGRVHVAWNGASDATQPKNPIAGTPMLYARLNDAATAFEPQRNLMTRSAILDGGGTVAADGRGNVYVAWHALGQDLAKGENNRKVWIAASHDDGATFASETPAWTEPTGACGCCGMRGFADRQGNAYFVYRAATNKINRGMYLLRTADHGTSFGGIQLDNWKIASCPMSSEAFAEGPSGAYVAWENDEQVYFARLEPGKVAVNKPRSVAGHGTNRKHPALAVNNKGELIVAWTEDTGWNRGGDLAWQVYDKTGQPTAEHGRRAGAIPVWSLPAVVADADGRFTIYH